MSRHFYIISLAMMLMVFTTGPSQTVISCSIGPIPIFSVNLYNEVGGMMDGSGGCFGGCLSDCVDCNLSECLGECMACEDCADCMGCDGCDMSPIPGTYAVHGGGAMDAAIQARLTSHAFHYFENMLKNDLTDALSEVPLFTEASTIELPATLADMVLCRGATAENAQSCSIALGFRDIEVQPLPATPDDRLRLSLGITAKLV